jgi:two-component system sensor histidine kinase TctE
VTRELVPNALDKQIDLGLEAVGEPVMVLGHPVLVREMLKNLIDNALRYTPEHGAVTVRIIMDRTTSNAHLEVEDDGPGIAPEERTLVFERFYRILGNGTDGSGLGLAIVREIAHQHGASVTLRSASVTASPGRPGTLAVVTFRLENRPADREEF